MTDLAKLVVKLEAQTAQFSQQLDMMTKKLNTFDSVAKGIVKSVAGAFAGFQVLSFAKSVIDTADHINDMSKTLGVAVEDLSRLQYAAEQSGTDLDSLGVGLKKLAKAASEAAGGSKEQKEAFDDIGVAVTDASGKLKPMQQILLEVAEKFSNMEDGAEKAAEAQKIFGKAGADLIPLLNEGAAGVQALMDQADALGITLSTETAQAADEFNDSLNTMKANAIGTARTIVGVLLPALTALSKGLNSIASGAVFVFQTIGKDIGALSASAVTAVQGDFAKAGKILDMRNADFEAEAQRFADKINGIWEGVNISEGIDKQLNTVLSEVKVTAKKIGDTLNNKFKFVGLEDIHINAQKIDVSPMENFYKELDDLTQTSTEKQLDQLAKIESALNELQAAHRITAEEAAKRWSEALDSVLDEVKVTAKKVGPEIMKEFDKVNEYQLELARNTQDIIADTLVNGFDHGVKGMLKAFEDMLTKLAAQAVAADIGKYIFGNIGAGGTAPGGKLGGLFGKGMDLLSGLFGGTKDSGGRGSAGSAYMIGTGAQPEMFVPDSAGTFYPRDQWSGGNGGVNNWYIQGTVSEQTRRQLDLDAQRRQRQALRFV
jgi:hypothetical protein